MQAIKNGVNMSKNLFTFSFGSHQICLQYYLIKY